jgi:hypothetical protein
MAQTREAMAPPLAERWGGQVARRDDSRVARRLYRRPVVDGVYQLDEGALQDDFFSFWHELGVGDWLGHGQGTAGQREMVPFVQSRLLDRLKPLFGSESLPALPALLCRDEARMRRVGFHAPQVRHGVCQRGATPRQGPRTTGPSCPEAVADTIVQLHLRALEAWFNGVLRALAKPGMVAAQVTGLVDATDLEPTAPYEGCGQATRPRQVTDKRGTVQASEVTVDGWPLIVLMETRPTLAGSTPRHKVVFEQGFVAGADWWGLA